MQFADKCQFYNFTYCFFERDDMTWHSSTHCFQSVIPLRIVSSSEFSVRHVSIGWISLSICEKGSLCGARSDEATFIWQHTRKAPFSVRLELVVEASKPHSVRHYQRNLMRVTKALWWHHAEVVWKKTSTYSINWLMIQSDSLVMKAPRANNKQSSSESHSGQVLWHARIWQMLQLKSAL